MRFAYADPPYPGVAHRYGEEELDHGVLIALLESHFPDGWVLSTSSVALKQVLNLCPDGTRICAWNKTWCSWKPGVAVAYAWEPVLLRGGRTGAQRKKLSGRKHATVKDWLACPAMQNGFFGAKPPEFCNWVFGLLGMTPEDEFVDIFHGSGAVKQAHDAWCRQRELPLVMA